MKKIILIILISIIFIYTSYKQITIQKTNSKTIYLIQVGAFSKIDNAKKESNKYQNSIIIEEDNLYKIISGICINIDTCNKIIKINEIPSTFINKKNITNKKLLDKIEKYDEIINNTNDIKIINDLIKDELSPYKLLLK